jgi:anti-sigma factor RsiW
MACELWTEKLDAYFDGELPSDEARALDEHLRGCPACAAEGLRRVQMKRAVQNAGLRFSPDPAFRARMQKKFAAPAPSPARWRWVPSLVTVTAATLLIASALILTVHRDRSAQRERVSELVDQHVATLASSSPVDVVSTDRHTVKPWFEGRIPFTFNLPELQGSGFVLVGGRVAYLAQSPGAELIFRVRQHQISVFIFQDRGLGDDRGNEGKRETLSFEVRSWQQNGLRYFVIGDAGPQDLDKLSELLKAAAG